MTITLRSTSVSVVLQRLSDEEKLDSQTLAALGVEDIPDHLDAEQRANLFKDVYMSVSTHTGELLYLLTRAVGARTVVEYGTSFGVSTVYLASAVRDNGGGTVITTELQKSKAAVAQANFVEAGLADVIDLRIGDARSTLSQLPRTVDLLLLDGWPDLELAVLRLVEPSLREGSLILIDDVARDWGRDVHGPLLEYLAEPASGYLSVRVPTGDGLQACMRID